MSTTIPIILAVALGTPAPPAADDPPPTRLDLATAMADPAWLGAYPERPRWTADGRLVFERRVGSTDERTIFEIAPDAGNERELSLEERAALTTPADWNADRSLLAAIRGDDVVVVTPEGTIHPLTRTLDRESNPRWLTDGRLAFERNGSTFARSLEDGTETEVVALSFADPPEPPDEPEGLAADQHRLFDAVREDAARREAARIRSEAARAADRHDVIGPVHLPPEEREVGRHLSPDGRWMLVELAARNDADGPRDDMPIWVTEDGYVTHRSLRPKVGTRERRSERLVLVDLASGEDFDVDLEALPDRRVDRLADIRSENRALTDPPAPSPASTSSGSDSESAGDIVARLATETLHRSEGPKSAPEDPPLRDVSVMRIAWHPRGLLAAAMIRSLDNKDRWIVTIDPRAIAAAGPPESNATTSIEVEEEDPTGPITVVEHLHDPAWINWSFNEMDWRRDGSELWYLSEGSGWSDLLAWNLEDGGRSLVEGPFEIRDVVEHPIDGTLLYRTNREDPGVWGLERLDPGTGQTRLAAGGSGLVERFTIAPDGSTVALLESTLARPAELFTVELRPFDAEPMSARRLTDSASEAFRRIDWTPASLVDVPGRHGRDIRGRLHLPPDSTPRLPNGGRPAVLFVHGAGYLQNGHAGWSRYFREGFFHDLLARDGFVVLDLDYRASSGYGRDWRTAIARDMGRHELDDYEDGIAWLAEHHDVDPDRIGIYGGSYGGFTTLMGLFTRPGVFKAGAALRPVTDWTYYNDGYTANILNTPQDDPLAYRRSSPIEHAAGLEDSLLICHGMIDSNVPYSDSVRLAQRLIELGKSDWELASYPVEGHGFRRDSSWIDEYRRIRELFNETLLPSGADD